MGNVKNNPKALIPVILVGLPVIVRTIIYIYVIIRGIGILGIDKYICIVAHLIMYISILRYAVDYFIKRKDVSLSGLILRFGIAALTTLIGLHSERSRAVFILTAIMVFIVPYISASLKDKNKPKKRIILVTVLSVVVLIIAVTLATLYIMEPIEDELPHMGAVVYNLNAMNSAVEWFLFIILGVARLIAGRDIKEDKPVSVVEASSEGVVSD